uniref:Uncharacterized protein n=1 Tax=Streptomyces ribosidificus TaxID=80859 RepID=Q2MFA9_STRRI|nr:hypothetical protein [Streptomyces ribosidificus]
MNRLGRTVAVAAARVLTTGCSDGPADTRCRRLAPASHAHRRPLTGGGASMPFVTSEQLMRRPIRGLVIRRRFRRGAWRRAR